MAKHSGCVLLLATTLELAKTVAAWPQLSAKNDSIVDVAFNADYDATGRVTLPGFDLSGPFPGSRSATWSLELNVTQHGTMPASALNSTSATVADYLDDFANNTTILTTSLIPPPPGEPGALFDSNGSWIVDSDMVGNAWKVSIISWMLDRVPTVTSGNDVEHGSCPLGMISDSCMERVRKAVMEKPNVVESRALLRSIPSCGPLYSNRAIAGTAPMNSSFLGGTTLFWGFPNKADMYNVLGAKTVPVLIVWGRRDGPGRLPEEHVQWACVKADRARAGASLPTGGSGRAAAGVRLGWHAAVVAIVVGLGIAA
ncbi:hypothetical protein Micbo1qcDRAFT_208023 [Microdochium bolleyi]|uniref:Uncharacterized protein n=1 Tax=Microdochium bolleyi TaxID=196109 RepID=A0A136IRA6_9PEZI|nr:hypothetical protein Micbo1qcDRAFT_208023 [Microdochium bolleyi]